jgi:hypothetical protein
MSSGSNSRCLEVQFSGYPRVRISSFLTGALTALLVSSSLSIACSSPTTPTVTINPPVSTANTPPTIQSLTTAGPRVEADQEIQVTAIVQDAETPVNQLTYGWSSSPIAGAFSGATSDVRWRAPKLATSPSLVTLALTVTEKYTSAGQSKENSVSSSTQVHYNDSMAESSQLSMDFLRDFTTFSVSPEQCVRNFSDNCRGKADELSDIRNNRSQFHILGGVFSVSSVAFNADRTFANIVAPCTFYDIRNDNGKHETVVGTCLLTTTYENWRWYLCDSNFAWIGTTTDSLKRELQFSHP